MFLIFVFRERGREWGEHRRGGKVFRFLSGCRWCGCHGGFAHDDDNNDTIVDGWRSGSFSPRCRFPTRNRRWGWTSSASAARYLWPGSAASSDPSSDHMPTREAGSRQESQGIKKKSHLTLSGYPSLSDLSLVSSRNAFVPLRRE